jgi:anti-sigma factor RsiW
MDLPYDELLSAYLDGELSADERAEVERRLAADPDSRQLLDELRALGTGLRSLPQARLDDDFVSQVMRRTEPEVQPAADGLPAADAPAADAPQPVGRSGELALEHDSWGHRLYRALRWPAVATAAGLLIWAQSSDDPADRRLAQHERDSASGLAAPAAGPREIPSMRSLEKRGEEDDASSGPWADFAGPAVDSVPDNSGASAGRGGAGGYGGGGDTPASRIARDSEFRAPVSESYDATVGLQNSEATFGFTEGVAAEAPVMYYTVDAAVDPALLTDYVDELLAANDIAWHESATANEEQFQSLRERTAGQTAELAVAAGAVEQGEEESLDLRDAPTDAPIDEPQLVDELDRELREEAGAAEEYIAVAARPEQIAALLGALQAGGGTWRVAEASSLPAQDMYAYFALGDGVLGERLSREALADDEGRHWYSRKRGMDRAAESAGAEPEGEVRALTDEPTEPSQPDVPAETPDAPLPAPTDETSLEGNSPAAPAAPEGANRHEAFAGNALPEGWEFDAVDGIARHDLFDDALEAEKAKFDEADKQRVEGRGLAYRLAAPTDPASQQGQGRQEELFAEMTQDEAAAAADGTTLGSAGTAPGGDSARANEVEEAGARRHVGRDTTNDDVAESDVDADRPAGATFETDDAPAADAEAVSGATPPTATAGRPKDAGDVVADENAGRADNADSKQLGERRLVVVFRFRALPPVAAAAPAAEEAAPPAGQPVPTAEPDQAP